MVNKLVQVILLVGFLIASASCETETRNITQWLDHFDENNNETWTNFYFVDESFYEPGGPIFLYIGDMTFYYTHARLNSSHFRDIAQESRGLLVGTEHRYYGDSRPVPDLTKDNLVYLTTPQALEDIAVLIRFLRSAPGFEDAKVVAGGIGHGASLATWMRQRYPDLIYAAWASSAKLNAILNFGEFHTNTADTIRIYGGQLCYNRMANAFTMLDQIYIDRNFEKLIEVFRLCEPGEDFEDELTIGVFFWSIAQAIGQYVSMTHAPGITNFCGYLERGDDDVTGLANWLYYTIFLGQGCVTASVEQLIYIFMDIDWYSYGNLAGGRQQIWQHCNEFGWFRSSNATDHPFGHRFHYNLFLQQCQFLFNWTITDEEILSNVANTNIQFGGLSPNVTRVYFTNGGLDPERTISILEDLNQDAPADVIPYFGYGADFIPMAMTVYEGLRAVQERVRFLIQMWLWMDYEPDTTTAPSDTTTEPATTTTDIPEWTPYYSLGHRQMRHNQLI